MILKRSPLNPLLTRENIPAVDPLLADPTSVFNPGAVRYGGKYLLLLRVQSRGRESFLLLAEGTDGEHFKVQQRLIHFRGIERLNERLYHIYDPRITQLGELYYVVFAADTDDGCRLGISRTADFYDFEFLGLGAERDIRNGVLFPQRFDGHYLRLDRPNRRRLAGGPTSGDEVCLSRSVDLLEWESLGGVFSGRPHYWDELVGPGPAPIKTEAGWLLIYHGIALHGSSNNIYQAGAVLLDTDDPSSVLARTRNNILEPRETYELVGQVPNVVFPSGMIVDGVDPDGCAGIDCPVRIYYGAADSVVALATTTVGELIDSCDPEG